MSFLHQPCCPHSAAAPQLRLIECDAILHSRMSSIVLLDKGAPSPIDGHLIFFLCCECGGAGGMNWSGFSFLLFKGTFSIVEDTHPNLL